MPDSDDDIVEVTFLRLSSSATGDDVVAGLQHDADTLAAAFKQTLDISSEVRRPIRGHDGTTCWIKFAGSKPAPFEVEDIFNRTAGQLTHTTGALFRQVTTHDQSLKL